MKIIKSLLLLTICLSTAGMLRAQEVKAEVKKAAEIKAPTDNAGKMVSPVPHLTPMAGVTLKEEPVPAAPTPSPSKSDDKKVQPDGANAVIVTRDANAANSKLTAEQLQTMNGTAQRPAALEPAAPSAAKKQ